MRHHVRRHLAASIRRARALVLGAVISGATAGATSCLLSLLVHRL